MIDFSEWQIDVGEQHQAAFGTLRFVLGRPDSERLGFASFPRNEQEADPVAEEVWVLPVGVQGVKPRVAGPELPVLVKLEKGLRIAAGAEAALLFEIPVCLRLFLGKDRQAPMFDSLCRSLSKTWIGSNVSGEMALEWRTPLLESGQLPSSGEDDLAICSLTLRNQSREQVMLERLSVRLAYSPLYLQDDRLWTCAIDVAYTGGGNMSDIHYQKSPPAQASRARMIAPARTPPGTKILAWTVQNLGMPGGFPI